MTTRFGDLVMVLPGILGSKLVRTTKRFNAEVVWNFSIRDLPSLLLEIAKGGLVYSPDDVDVDAVDLFEYQLFPGFFGVDSYVGLVDTLGRSLGNAGQLVTFPYDWRASNALAATALKTRANDALRTWRTNSGNTDAKLWLICHSMGGLVARYFCEELGGADITRTIVTLGTPHRGAVKALDALANGKRFGPLSLDALVRSLPSVYELLPLFPCIRLDSEPFALKRIADFFGLDPVTGEDLEHPDPVAKLMPSTPLANLDRGMLKKALEFHAKIRVPALARPAGEQGPYTQEAFLNRRQPTSSSARLSGGRLEIFDFYPELRDGRVVEPDQGGDGTVPFFSSVPIEWDDTLCAYNLDDKHAALQGGTILHESLNNWINPLDVRAKRDAAQDQRAVPKLKVPAVVSIDEEWVVETAAISPGNFKLQVEQVETGNVVERGVLHPGGDRPVTTAFKGLPQGVHRIKVLSPNPALPVVSDYTLVLVD